MRALHELIDLDESAWPQVQAWINESSVNVEILAADAYAADAALLASQLTTRSPMGSIVHNAAGIFIDDGWLRVLGAGGTHRFQRSLPAWNEGRTRDFYLVADDAVGGFFAINGGAFGTDLGNIYFFSPDALEWEPCKFGYSQFLVWAMSASLGEFYSSFRWKNWESEVTLLSGDQVIGIYPYLWAEGPSVDQRHRSVIPVSEQYDVQLNLRRHMIDGTAV